MSHIMTRSRTRQLNLQYTEEKMQSNFGQMNFRQSNCQNQFKRRKMANHSKHSDHPDTIKLQSGKPLKRNHIVEFGKPSDYHIKLNKDGKPIDRGTESRLMDPYTKYNDPYYWIRSDDRTDEDVLDLLNQLNLKTKKCMELPSITEFETQLFDEMKGMVSENETFYPKKFFNTGYLDYTRMEENKGHPIHCRKEEKSDEEIVLLDINEFVKTVEKPDTCDVSNVTTSYDCKYLSYAVDLTGNEKYDLHLYDLETRQKVEHNIPDLIVSFYQWGPDSKSIFYYGYDANERVNQIWVYDLLSDKSTLLYEESDTLFDVSFSISKTFNYIFITASSSDSSEVRFVKCNQDRHYLNPDAYKVIRTRETGVKYYLDTVDYQNHFVNFHGVSINQGEEMFIIRTNIDSATNFKICYANPFFADKWTTIIPHSEDRYITSIDTIKNYILIDYRENGYTRAGYYHVTSYYTGGIIVPIDVQGNVVGLKSGSINSIPSTISFLDSANLPYDTNEVYITYDSLVHPAQIIKIKFENNSNLHSEVVWKKTIPNYDPANYETRILTIKSSTDPSIDIPVSIIYKKGICNPDKPTVRPLLLYGYGSYGINIDPMFDPKIIPLLDRSFVYAIAHVRGSSAKGYEWYTSGKMANKQNSFTDFIDCAKYLINNNYTKPELLSIEGRSAGGLLMGAVLTQAPELFNTVIMGVPFLDVLVTMRDSTIPLTTGEWVEWGNPNYEDDYRCMKKYSPMENIKNDNYPNTYITCGLTDPRVQYWEPVKFQLRLLENCTDKNLHLIKIDMEKGHFSNTDRYAKLKEYSKQYAFIVHNTMNAI